MIGILRALLALLESHPELLPSLGRLIESVAKAPSKADAMREAERAAAKAAIRS